MQNVVSVKSDKSMPLVHMGEINKQANLGAFPETLTSYKCLDVSFVGVFSNILISCISGNSLKQELLIEICGSKLFKYP